MPTLPLFLTNPSVPDAWHNVTAPGGYEWWYFDAEDPATNTQIVGIFLDGFVFHPGYLRRYFRFRRFPTRVKPPLPRDYPCAYFVLYRNGRIARQFMTQYAPEQFAASMSDTNVRIGPNTLVRNANGDLHLSMRGTPWRVTWRGPKREPGATLSAELTFRPLLTPAAHERRFLSKRLAGADHHWVIADPLCEVRGEIDTGEVDNGEIDTGGGAGEKIQFRGRGYHDHNYGTGPVGPGLKRWIWGRVLLDTRAYTFHFARASDPSLPDEVHLVEADDVERREVAVSRVEADWSKRTGLGLTYPKRIAFDDVVRLEHPRVADSAPFYMRLIYDATCRGEKGTALCEVAYPHRLRWPVLGRMIEMSIDRQERAR